MHPRSWRLWLSRRLVLAALLVVAGLLAVFPPRQAVEFVERTVAGCSFDQCPAVEHKLAKGLGAKAAASYPEQCDPYEQRGVLVTNWSVPRGNRWAPISAPTSCQPTDYMELTRAAEAGEYLGNELDFMRDRLVVIFGDSVDRDHNEHFCALVGGEFKRIHADNPLSPPYPPGQELPPETYRNPWTHKREWQPDYDQSRPYICHVKALNFRIVNVFHFGFQELTDWLLNYFHYYPPTTALERFESITVPLANNIAQEFYGTKLPDLLTVSTGFWDILAHSVGDDWRRDQESRIGANPDETSLKFDTYRTMPADRRQWFETNIRKLLLSIAQAWPEGKGTKPKILWRALHHPRAQHLVTITSVAALDAIGRSVVEQLIEESRAAEAGRQAWEEWTEKVARHVALSQSFERGSRTWEDVKRWGLSRRLKIDEWGSLMLGQEIRQRDDLHPLPLPGSYLYGNMLLHQLQQTVSGFQG